MKTCSMCKEDKPLEAFKWKQQAEGIRQSQCDPCRRATAKRSYERHKASVIKKSMERGRTNWEWYRSFKQTCACVACGEAEPACLDFHHTNPNEKDLDPSSAFSRMGRSRFLAEIAKCVCLCANCHRKVHAGVLNISP